MNVQHVPDRIALLRIIDAAANRGREGLRVLEDWVRFGLDDAHLTVCLKQIRHDLATALASIPWPQRLAARNTEADVGTAIHTAAELSRASVAEVLTANFLRLQESLRSLEEFGKLFDPAVGEASGQIRYRTYTLQRAIDATRVGSDRLPAVGSTSWSMGGRPSRSSSGLPGSLSRPASTSWSCATSGWPIGNFWTVPGGCED